MLGKRKLCSVSLRGERVQCASPPSGRVYSRPSDLIWEEFVERENLTKDQMLFMLRFAKSCNEAWEDEDKAPEARRTHHLLLLGQSGAGKTYLMQNLVFPVVDCIWPSVDPWQEPSLLPVAFSNAQAKDLSTLSVPTRTIHRAGHIGVQRYTNQAMCPSETGVRALARLWGQVRVLVFEEISTVPARLYNMLDLRAMFGRNRTGLSSWAAYCTGMASFGRCPIVIHVGDFLQLGIPAGASLVADTSEKSPGEAGWMGPEGDRAIGVFQRIRHVFMLEGKTRCVWRDPLIDLLRSMRAVERIPDDVWAAFEQTFARDSDTVVDARHAQEHFRSGYGMALYWETLARWIPTRVRRDARTLGVPLVVLRAEDERVHVADEGVVIDTPAVARLLNIPNWHTTGCAIRVVCDTDTK